MANSLCLLVQLALQIVDWGGSKSVSTDLLSKDNRIILLVSRILFLSSLKLDQTTCVHCWIRGFVKPKFSRYQCFPFFVILSAEKILCETQVPSKKFSSEFRVFFLWNYRLQFDPLTLFLKRNIWGSFCSSGDYSLRTFIARYLDL